MKNFIISQWNHAENYFEKNLKQTYYFCFFLFGVLIIVNVILFQNNSQVTQLYYEELMTVFKEKSFLESTGLSLWFGIFVNNLMAGAITIVAGLIPFLFLPILSLASNAIVVGLMGAVYQMNGMGWIPLLVGILPHGVLEIPAFILGVTLGVHICFKLVKTILRKNFKGEFKQAIIASVRIFFFWMVPLFIVAAFIEAFLTPVLFNALI